ncbi:hypothetical protein B0H14DRAFT_2613397 [Mycena olivaceomarginata]|nr:hypothetical protein B0H14DRAFT_2613397 [Mycena olivaceomarginata]
MPRGQPRLDPNVKTQNLAESRKRYGENSCSEGSQSKRAEIAASDNSTRRKYLGQAASNSERYRDRKHAQEREEQRAADAVIKKARTRKKVELHKKHKPLPKSPPPVAKPPPKLLPTVAKPPHRRRAPSPITPTPVSNAHATVGEQDNRSMDDESDEEHPIEVPIWPTRAHRPQCCPHCYQEDCVGCACLCSESDEWFDHPGGHYFPTCVCKGEDCPGCFPTLATKTDGTIRGRFMWWFLRRRSGGESSLQADEAEVPPTRAHSRPRPGCASTSCGPWTATSTITTKESNLRPRGKHTTGRRNPVPLLLHPLSPNPPPRVRPPLHPSSAPPTKSGLRKENAPRNASRMSKEELAYLASSRPPPGPISKNRLTQQFARIWDRRPSRRLFLPRTREEPRTTSPARQRTHPAITASEVQAAPHTGPIQSSRASHSVARQNNIVEKIDAGARGSTLVLYAISGRNRVFQDRSCAMAVLQGTPGADLLFTRNEDELFKFLAEEVTGKMKM